MARPMRIVSLSRGSVPCEFATRLVADAGIAVVKIEMAEGDPLRAQRPPLFAYLAAGKQSVALPEQRFEATLTSLLSQSDALVVDEWGRDIVAASARSVPMIVVGERDGAAVQGILRERSDEFLAFHGTGLGYITPRVMPGYPSRDPLCPEAHLIEFLAGLYGAIAVLAMLVRSGDAVDASVGITAAVLPLLRREIAAVLYDGAKPHRSERIWKVSPAEVHRCTDGWVFVDVIEDVQWTRLCEYMGRPDLAADPRYATRDQRFARAESLCAVLDQFFATRPKSCWIEAQARGVPVAPVNGIEDLLRDPQLESRGFWTHIDAADGAPLVAPVSPLARLFRTGQAPATTRAPTVGEHTAEVLRMLAAA